MEEVCSTLEAKVDSLTYSNEGLMIQNESLDRDVFEWDNFVEEARAESEALHRVWDWIF